MEEPRAPDLPLKALLVTQTAVQSAVGGTLGVVLDLALRLVVEDLKVGLGQLP